jgi:hypothetical protein
MNVFNHHPPPPRSTRAAAKAPVPFQAPSEFQVNIARILLSELGDINSQDSDGPQIMKLIFLFVTEVIESKDMKLVKEIHEGICCHILKTDNSMDSLGKALEKIVNFNAASLSWK